MIVSFVWIGLLVSNDYQFLCTIRVKKNRTRPFYSSIPSSHLSFSCLSSWECERNEGSHFISPGSPHQVSLGMDTRHNQCSIKPRGENNCTADNSIQPRGENNAQRTTPSSGSWRLGVNYFLRPALSRYLHSEGLRLFVRAQKGPKENDRSLKKKDTLTL